MVRAKLNIGCRYSTPVRERPLHPTHGQFTPEASQTQAPVTLATEPGRRAGGGLTTMEALRDHRRGETSKWDGPREDAGLKKQMEVLASGVVESARQAGATDGTRKS